MTRLTLSRTARARIIEQLESGYPEEACGALLGRHHSDTLHVVDIAPVENARAEERRRRYLISPGDVLRLDRVAEAAGYQVIGYYHSHPDAPARPSSFDREHAWPWYVYIIVSVYDGRASEMKAWRLSDDRQVFGPVEIRAQDQVRSSEATGR